MTTLNLAIKLTTDGTGKVKADLLGVENAIAKTGNTAKQSTPHVSGFGRLLSGVITAAGVAATINAVKEYERLGAVMKTLTGDVNIARVEMDKLKDFAATTPFELQNVIEAFARLQSVGLDPSTEALRSYGNTAAAMGRDLMQFVEAVADATTGEFERLKDFGIKSAVEGDKVKFTFRGVTTEVKKNAGDIERYLRTIGDTDFASGMQDQMDTLGGAVSNFKDEMFQLAGAIGDAGLSDLLRGLVGWLTNVAKVVREDVVPEFSELLEKLGLYEQAVKRIRTDDLADRLRVARGNVQQLEIDIATNNDLTQRQREGLIQTLHEQYARVAELETELAQRKNTPGLPSPDSNKGGTSNGTTSPSKDAFEKWRKELQLDAEATAYLQRQIAYLDEQVASGAMTFEQHDREIEKLTGNYDDAGDAAESASARIQGAVKAFRDGIVTDADATDELQRKIAVLDDMVANGDIGFEQHDREVQKITGSFDDLKDKGVDTFKELKDAVDGFAKDLTKSIADAVFEGKASLADLANSFTRILFEKFVNEKISEPLLNAGFDILQGMLKHGGGMVGAGGGLSRTVPAYAFTGAPRFHNGGVIDDDEVPIIARRGEEVLTENDPRHRNNLGGKAVKVVIENKGAPIQAQQAGASFDAEGMIVRIFTTDLQRNGPMTNGMMRKFPGLRGGG